MCSFIKVLTYKNQTLNIFRRAYYRRAFCVSDLRVYFQEGLFGGGGLLLEFYSILDMIIILAKLGDPIRVIHDL